MKWFVGSNIMKWFRFGLAIAFFCFIFIGYQNYQAMVKRNEEMYGPNPGVIDFETNHGSGFATVRDVENAEQEIRATFKKSYEQLGIEPREVVFKKLEKRN